MLGNRISERCGLSDSVVEKIRAVFQSIPAVEKAVLYGSRAKGNYRDGSDIDLTLFGQQLSYPLLVKIETQLDELLLPYIFDLSLFSHIENEELIDHIGRVGWDFYRKDS
jgi:uncharacterized protein